MPTPSALRIALASQLHAAAEPNSLTKEQLESREHREPMFQAWHVHILAQLVHATEPRKSPMASPMRRP